MAWQASAESEKVKKSAGRPSIGSCGNSPIPHESSNIYIYYIYIPLKPWFSMVYMVLTLSLYIHILYIIIYIHIHILGSHYWGYFILGGKHSCGQNWEQYQHPKNGSQASKKAEKEELKVWMGRPTSDHRQMSHQVLGDLTLKSRDFSNEHGLGTCKIGVSNKESGKHQNTVPNVS